MIEKVTLRGSRPRLDAAEAQEAPRSSLGSASNGPTASDAGSETRASLAGSTSSSSIDPLPTIQLRLTGGMATTLRASHGAASLWTGGSSDVSAGGGTISVRELRQRYTARIARNNQEPFSPGSRGAARAMARSGGDVDTRYFTGGTRHSSSSSLGHSRHSSSTGRPSSGSGRNSTGSGRHSSGSGRAGVRHTTATTVVTASSSSSSHSRRPSNGGSRRGSGGGCSGAGGARQRPNVTAIVTATSQVRIITSPSSSKAFSTAHQAPSSPAPSSATPTSAATTAGLRHAMAKAAPASFDCEAGSTASTASPRSCLRGSGTVSSSPRHGNLSDTFGSATISPAGTLRSSGLSAMSAMDVHPRSKRVRWRAPQRRHARLGLGAALRSHVEGPERPQAVGLTEDAWMTLRSTTGKIIDMAAFLRAIRSGGIEPHIRPAVWPLLLGLVGPSDSELTKRAKWAAACREFGVLCVLAEDDVAASVYYDLQGAQEPWLTTKRRIVTDAVRTASDGPLFCGSARADSVARLERLLMAYALYDPPTGYCQGMADLAAPFVHLYPGDGEAFAVYCRMLHPLAPNFQEGLTAISGQLRELRAILAALEGPLLRHLERIGAATFESAFQMLLLLFRRELSWSATFTFWEALWAAEAAAHVPLRVYAVAALFSSRREELMQMECLEDVVMWANGIGSTQDRPLDPIALAADAYTMWRYVSTAAAASERAAARCSCVPPMRFGERARGCRAAADVAAAVAVSGGSARLLAFGPSA